MWWVIIGVIIGYAAWRFLAWAVYAVFNLVFGVIGFIYGAVSYTAGRMVGKRQNRQDQ